MYFSSTDYPRDAALQEHLAEDEDDEENNGNMADVPAHWGFTHSDQELDRQNTIGWLLEGDTRTADDREADFMDICESSDADTEYDWDSAVEADIEDNCSASEAEDQDSTDISNDDAEYYLEESETDSEEEVL